MHHSDFKDDIPFIYEETPEESENNDDFKEVKRDFFHKFQKNDLKFLSNGSIFNLT